MSTPAPLETCTLMLLGFLRGSIGVGIVGLGILDRKRIFEEALGQAVAADNVARALAANGSELHFAVFHLYQMQIGHAGEHACRGLFRDGGEFPGRPRGMESLGLCRLPFLAAYPNLLEQVIEADFVLRRK